MQQGMTIGRLAQAAGVNVETIRYYQRRGLIGEPHKPPGGHRRYPPGVLQQIAFIRRAQQLGFSLAEVKALLQHGDGKNLRETRAIAERKMFRPHAQDHAPSAIGRKCARIGSAAPVRIPYRVGLGATRLRRHERFGRFSLACRDLFHRAPGRSPPTGSTSRNISLASCGS